MVFVHVHVVQSQPGIGRKKKGCLCSLQVGV